MGRKSVAALLAVVALGAIFLPHAWLWWTLRGARALRPGDGVERVRAVLGAPDVRLAGAVEGECWAWFWPDSPLRSLCKRLPWSPRSEAFELHERSAVMVRVWWGEDDTLQTVATD